MFRCEYCRQYTSSRYYNNRLYCSMWCEELNTKEIARIAQIAQIAQKEQMIKNMLEPQDSFKNDNYTTRKSKL